MIILNLPEEVEQDLRAEYPDLEQRALEHFVVEAYRRGELGTFQVRQIFGFESRWQAINFLSERGVYPNYGIEQLNEDRANHAEVFGEHKTIKENGF